MSSYTAPGPPCPPSHATYFLPLPSPLLATSASHFDCDCDQDCNPREGGREGEGLWGFQMGSGKWHSQSAPSHVRPSLATSGSRDLARSHSARHESWGSDGGGSESPSLKALLHQNGLDSRGCSSGTEWPSARQLRGAKVNSAALGRGWGGARTHQPRTSASW